jgi:aspartyl aminopeptidase
MLSKDNTIFVGVKVNERLRDQLDASPASMQAFFNEKNPEYLQVVQIDEDEYIGKITANGAVLETLGNMLQNVKTMLQMICPKFTVADGAIKIFALAPTPVRAYQ